MKVLLVNGSPNHNGCTYTALTEVAKTLEENGIDTQWFHIGTKPVRGCVACRKCSETGICVFNDDVCNELIEKIREADGLVVGSPVYFSGPNGALCALLHRVFFGNLTRFRYKPAAAVVSVRRTGASASIDRLNKYFTIAEMPVVSSMYWSAVHGNEPEHVLLDLEGMQTMRVIGKNMAWMLKNIESGATPPEPEPERMYTCFHDGK